MEIHSSEAFVSYLESIRGRTNRVAACIPEEQIEWTHREGAFTLGDLVRHLAAIERFMFAENVAGRPSIYPGHGRELANGKEAVLAYLARMHAESLEIFRALTPDALMGRCTTPAGTSIPVWKWLRSMIEHEVHHRGQIYLMLGMLRVPTPPLYGLTEEKVRALSGRGEGQAAD